MEQLRATQLSVSEPMTRLKPALLRVCVAAEQDAPVQPMAYPDASVQMLVQLDAQVLSAAPAWEARLLPDAQLAWAARVWAPDAEEAASERHRPMKPARRFLPQQMATRRLRQQVPKLPWVAVEAEERPSLLPREPKRR